MAKKARAAGTASNRTVALDKLQPSEAAVVLERLIAAHPEFRAEAEQIARSVLGTVSFESVADDVEDAVRQLDLDDLNGRAGSHSWGYTEPGEAAWELLEEAVEPFVEEMKRHLDLGLEAEALQICQGVVLGLYQLRNETEAEFLGPRLSRGVGREHRGRLGEGEQAGNHRQGARAESRGPAPEVCRAARSRMALDLGSGCRRQGRVKRRGRPTPETFAFCLGFRLPSPS